MLERMTITGLKLALREPGRFVGEARRLAAITNSKVRSGAAGFNIMSADWDVLIILDGCRLDLFTEVSTLPGKTESVNSGASQSAEFMHQHFHNGEFYDTVYISANPYTETLNSGVFHDIRNVYTTHWDDEIETVHPEDVRDVALTASDKYPKKRLIVHFMQPHYPFIGERGREFDTGGAKFGRGNDVWQQLRARRCPVDKETVWRAYVENYQLAESAVRELHRSVTGKAIVTADHGNLIGERMSPIPLRGYGHPRGLVHKALREVPWHKLPFSERRKVVTDPPTGKAVTADPDAIEEKLRALGYR